MEGFKQWFIKSWKSAKSPAIGHLEEYDLVLSFPDISWLPKILSPERIRLIQTIRELKPESVYQLAKYLERATSNVQKDVSELAEMGILELKKYRKKGQKRSCTRPLFKWSGFDIAV